MNCLENQRRSPVRRLCLLWLIASARAMAGDNAELISVTITNGTPILPRTVCLQTWTMKNTGTTTWSPTFDGYTTAVQNRRFRT